MHGSSILHAAVSCAALTACGEASGPSASQGSLGGGDVVPAAPMVVFLGDSLTAGYGLEPEGAFPALIDERIEELGWSYSVVNAGVSGDTTSGGVSRIDWVLGQGPVAALVLGLGANDALRGLDPKLIERNLETILERTRARFPRAALVVVGMRAPPNMGGEYAAAFQAVFPRVARKYDADLVPFLLEGVAGEPNLNLEDGIHPNAAGQRVLADNVWEVLRPALAERSP